MLETVVVDTSVAIKWIIDEPDSDIAQALLTRWTNMGVVMLAPALFMYEIMNILYQHVRRKEITLEEAKVGREDFLSIGVEVDFSENPDLNIRAIELAYKYSLPATYDPHYIALAEREGCEFWTADVKLWKAVKDRLSWVHLLREYHVLQQTQ